MNSKKKKKTGLIEISMRESNNCMFFMEANRSNIFQIIDRRTFYIFLAVLMFCKVNILLFSSILNMITASLGRWVCGRWSVDLIKLPFRRWYKPPKHFNYSTKKLNRLVNLNMKHLSVWLNTNKISLKCTEDWISDLQTKVKNTWSWNKD